MGPDEKEELKSPSVPDLPIQKKVLHAGKGDLPKFADGTKVIFHFVAKRLDEDATLLDDSRKWSKPMEIILGKKFKLESWETSLSTMRIGEVASFTTKRVYTHSYPLVAKTLRDNYLPKKEGHDHKKHEHKAHMCGMMAMQAEGGLGYDDLNQLMKGPEDLEFIFEYYAVIEHCTEVLQHQPDNVKALFRRGKAHVGAWNPKEAKADFEAVIKLDNSLTKACKKEISDIELLEKIKDQEDKAKMSKLFS